MHTNNNYSHLNYVCCFILHSPPALWLLDNILSAIFPDRHFSVAVMAEFNFMPLYKEGMLE